jgi:pimeloyl-ACP methyl ester carboxylesterase/predicted amino acid-binding ACT domain protein
MTTATDETTDVSWHALFVEQRPASYAVGGRGLPVLLLHGWGLGYRTYQTALQALMARGCRVYAPALPGFGGTADLAPLGRTMAGYASWVGDFLDAVGLDEPVLVVGHSFGGGVAIQLAHDQPGRVRHVVLVNSVGSPSGAGGPLLTARPPDRPPWQYGLAFAREMLWSREAARVVEAMSDDLVHNMVLNPRALLEIGALARSADLTAELAELRRREVPILVLWSDGDSVLPLGSFDALCAAIGTEGKVLRGGHSWLLADPRALSKVLDNVLQVQVAAQEEVSAGSNVTELRALLRRTTIPRAVTNQLLAAAAPLWTISERPAVLAADLALCHPPLAVAEVRAAARPMDGDAFRLTVVAHDRTGLLADTAAAVAAAGLSVHSASVTTWTDRDLALHALTVVPARGTAPDWDALGLRLRSAITEPPKARRFTPKGRATVMLAGAGPGPSIVRVTARDQVGLLEAISRWFADHGVGILAADIATRGGTATDRFVVDGDFDHTALADHLSGPRRSPFRLRRPSCGVLAARS